MPTLQLHVLGAPQWLLDGAPFQGFQTRKMEALLIYLAVNRQVHRRDALTAMFWPEIGEEYAKNNLRRTLSNLRQVVGSHLRIDRSTIAFNSPSAYWLDVEQFCTRLTSPLTGALLASLSIAGLEEALALYRADFLVGFIVRDAPLFEEWARLQREYLHNLAIQGLEQLTTLYLHQQDFDAGLTTTQRLLTLEPWRESAHQQRMKLFYLTGQPASALVQFERCRQILAAELGADPQPETVALYQQIKAGTGSSYPREQLDASAHDMAFTVTGASVVGSVQHGNALSANNLAGTIQVELSPASQASHGAPQPVRQPFADDQPTTRPAGARPPHNLPKQLTSFFGRTEEIAELVTQLTQTDERLITLFGEGGVGKTRLALAVGQALIDGASRAGATAAEPFPFPDGIWYVSLSGLQPTADLAEQLAAAIAQTVDFVFKQSNGLRKQLLAYIQNKQMLLILDNFEALVAGRDFVLELLRQTDNVKLLLTSRQLLNLQVEVVWSVTGLPTPPLHDARQPSAGADHKRFLLATDDSASDEDEPTTLLRYPSIALFVERARRVQRTFQLNRDHWQDVVAICRLSAGLPLAIELAAAQVKIRSCAAIRQTLETAATSLATKYYDIPERQRSLATVLENSWQLLTPQERTVLAATAVFAESFTPAAATAVAGMTPAIGEDLYDKAMLRRTTHDRYQLHPFVQQFAGAQLLQLGLALAATVSARHGHYYLHLVRDQRAVLVGPTPQQASQRLQQDLLNIDQAWQWAVAQLEVSLLAESCQGLADFHSSTFLWTQGKERLADAVAAVQQQLAQYTERKVEERADGAAITQPPLKKQLEGQLATLHSALAHILITQEEPSKAIQQAQQATALAEQWGLSAVAARSRYAWGLALFDGNDYKPAEQKLTQALALARTTGMTDLVVNTLMCLGRLMQRQGEYTKAHQFAQEALQISRTAQMLVAEQRALVVIGIIYYHRGDFHQAKASYEAALPLAKACNQPFHQVDILGNLGAVHDGLGQYDAAQRYYHAALALSRQLGHRSNQAMVLGNLGIAADYLGDYAAALRYSQESFQILESLAMTGALPTSLVNLALHAHHLGDQPLAYSYSQEALTLSVEGNDRLMQSYARTVLGHAALGLDRPEEAEVAYTEAIALARELALPLMQIEPQAGLVRVALASAAPQPQMRHHIQTLVDLITAHGVEGLEEPFRVYYTCYEGLRKLGDPRCATILQTAFAQLQTRAAQIDDDELRHSFLHNVTANRALCQITICQDTTAEVR